MGTYRALFGLLLVLIRGHHCTGNAQCGVLSVLPQSADVGATVAFTFSPSPSSGSIRLWYRGATLIYDSRQPGQNAKYVEWEEAGNHLLAVKNVDKSDAGLYLVRCEQASSTAVQLYIGTGPCGSLTARSSTVLLGTELVLMLTKFSLSGHVWQFNNSTGFVNIPNSPQYEFPFGGNNFNLKKVRTTSQDSGQYRVRCLDDTVTSVVDIRIVDPTPRFFVQGSAHEGMPTTLVCEAVGIQPPSMVLQYNDTFITKGSLITDKDGLSRVEIRTQVNFSRYDNRKKLRCCSYSTNVSPGYCSEMDLDISFPSRSITLTEVEISKSMSGLEHVLLKCETTEAKPANNISWYGLKNKWRKRGDLKQSDGPDFGGIVTIQELRLNVTKEKNGHKIRCVASNNKFPSTLLEAGYTINITYSPIIYLPEINITATEGQHLAVVCGVDSNPAARVTWLNESGHIFVTGTNRRTDEMSLLFSTIQMSESGIYTCTANNGLGPTRSATVNITVIESVFNPLSSPDTDKGSNSAVVAAILSILATIAVVAVVIVCVRRRRSLTGSRSSDDTQEAKCEVQQNNDDVTSGPFTDNVSTGSPVGTNDMPMYSQVIPKSQRIKQSSQQAPAHNGELMYAELELAPSSPVPLSRAHEDEEEQTEYSSIDFVQSANMTEDIAEHTQ